MNLLLGPLKLFLHWLMEMLITKGFNALREYIAGRQRKSEQEKIAQENLKRYENAIKEGKDAEIARAAEDLLNNTKR